MFMKSLELSSTTKKAFPTTYSGKAYFILQLSGVFAGLAVLLLAFWLYQFPEKQAREAVTTRSLVMLELAGDAAIGPLKNLRHSLALLARMPVLRDFKRGDSFVSALMATRNDLKLLIESYEVEIALGWQAKVSFERSLSWWVEIPDAFLRRVTMLFALHKETFAEDSEDLFPEMETISEAEHERILAQTQLVPQSIAALEVLLDQFLSPALSAAESLEGYFGFRNDMLADVSSAENLLAVALNDGLYRTIVLKNLQGSVIALAGDSDASAIRKDSRDCQAVIRGGAFFSGPTGYDPFLKRPLWWVAVPVRDENRRPIACLAALVDITYLSELAKKLANGHDSLFFVDRNGVAIGHADDQLVARQVNLRSSLIPVESVEDKSSTRILRLEGRPVFQAAAALKNSEYRYLPDWYVFLHTDLNSFFANEYYLVTVCVILLAATGMYVLSCCVVRLINSSNEEN